jgi:hypothetical protein
MRIIKNVIRILLLIAAVYVAYHLFLDSLAPVIP